MEKQRISSGYRDIDHLNGEPVKAWVEFLSEYKDGDNVISIKAYDDGYLEMELVTFREETDEEVAIRIEKSKDWQATLKENRYNNYLKLKEEFELKDNSSDISIAREILRDLDEYDKTDSTVQDN